MSQGYFPTYTPRTANLAAIYKDFNPGAAFLSGMKAVSTMDLERAAEERLKQQADTDAYIRNTVLPYTLREANAKIKNYQAESALRSAQAGYWSDRKIRESNSVDFENTVDQLLDGMGGRSILGGTLQDAVKGTLRQPSNAEGEPSAALFAPKDFYKDENKEADDAASVLLPPDQTGSENTGNPLFDDLEGPMPDFTSPNVDVDPGISNKIPENAPRFASATLPIGSAQSDTPTLVGQMVKESLDDDKPLSLKFDLSGREQGFLPDETEAEKSARVFSDLPDAAPEPPSFSYGNAWSIHQMRKSRAESIKAESNLRPKDPESRVMAILAEREVAQDEVSMDAMLRGTGMDSNVAAMLSNKFADTSAIDEAIEIRRNGASEFGVNPGAPWGVIAEAISRRRAKPFEAPATVDLSKRATEAISQANMLYGMLDKETDLDRRMEIQDQASALLRSAVPPDIRAGMVQDRQQRLISMTADGRMSRNDVNYLGEPVKDSEIKVTAFQRFGQRAGVDYPVVSAELLPDGQVKYDANAIPEINKWHEDNGFNPPEGMIPLMGLRVKTDKGIKVYPVQGGIGKDKDGNSLLQTRSAYMELPKFGEDGGGSDGKGEGNRQNYRAELAKKLKSDVDDLLWKSENVDPMSYVEKDGLSSILSSDFSYALGANTPEKKVEASKRLKAKAAEKQKELDSILKSMDENPLENLPEPPAKKTLPKNAPGDPQGRINWPERP